MKRTTTFNVDFIYVCLSLEHNAKLWEEEDLWAAVMLVFLLLFYLRASVEFGVVAFSQLLTTPPRVGRELANIHYAAFSPFFETNDNGKSFHLYFSILETRAKPGYRLCRWSSKIFLRIYRFSFLQLEAYSHFKTIFCCFRLPSPSSARTSSFNGYTRLACFK